MQDHKAVILIIDDTPQNIDIATYVLEEDNYQVLAATNGKTGFQIAKKNHPDLILLDIMMPEQDGFQTCNQLKDDDDTINIPIIFMSALTSISDKSKGFQLGGVDYITKPIQPEEVLLRVNLHIELNQLRQELLVQNEYLEKKIRERTSDLVNSNNLLNSEIAKRYEIEKDLIQAKEKAESSDRLKSEFLAQMSHEIRTPINAILSLTGLIVENVVSKDFETTEMIQLIENAGQRIIRTIDLLINMSEIQTGSYEINLKENDLLECIINPIAKYYHNNYDMNNNKLTVKNNVGKIKFKFDEYSVYQIIDNLINNAIKFTNDGEICVDLDKKDDSLIIKIKDTGIGIDTSYLQNLFTPFSQEEQGYARKFEGNGLGLALVKHYCELNKIEISVASTKNKGTTFTLIFNSQTSKKYKIMHKSDLENSDINRF